jgi:acetate kinase
LQVLWVGLDTVVFTAGIGENAPTVRQRICDGLSFMGIEIDPKRNSQNSDIISSDGARATVRVLHTDEDVMIARHTASLLKEWKSSNVHV